MPGMGACSIENGDEGYFRRSELAIASTHPAGERKTTVFFCGTERLASPVTYIHQPPQVLHACPSLNAGELLSRSKVKDPVLQQEERRVPESKRHTKAIKIRRADAS